MQIQGEQNRTKEAVNPQWDLKKKRLGISKENAWNQSNSYPYSVGDVKKNQVRFLSKFAQSVLANLSKFRLTTIFHVHRSLSASDTASATGDSKNSITRPSPVLISPATLRPG